MKRTTTRRTFSLALGGVLALPFLARAQKRARVAVIGLGALESEPYATLVRTLSEFGYSAGRNIEYGKPAEGEGDAVLARLVGQALEQRADVLFAFGATATDIAAKATRTVPIVALVNADPVQSGLVKELARPGGNVTGIWLQGPELAKKRVELIKQLVPGIRRLAVFFDPSSVGGPQMVKYAADAAQQVGIETNLMELAGAEDIARMAARVKTAKSQALFVETSVRLYQQHRAAILENVAKLRLPAVYNGRFIVREGGLASYGVDGSVQTRRAAYFVDRILKGARAADLPMEQPTQFQLTINLKTAKTLGIKVPSALLTRADEVIMDQ
ncbi:MAG: ABC transporter substrate-binding protein [Betaproteobacteria bacterium]|nr:ABC transporter substrate-binding protein [Betaproteobacteria bacterium]